MAPLPTIDSDRVTPNRKFSGVQTSIKSLRKWPGHLDSAVLIRSSENSMGQNTEPSNFEDRGFSAWALCSLVLWAEGITMAKDPQEDREDSFNPKSPFLMALWVR